MSTAHSLIDRISACNIDPLSRGIGVKALFTGDYLPCQSVEFDGLPPLVA